MKKYDVIVIGGGVSGTIAGIASARTGAKTLIIEKMGFLGGTLTAGGVGPMMTFHAGHMQVVRGLAQEVIDRLAELNGTTGHILDTTGYTYTVTPFDAELLKHVLEKMVIQAGGELLYHSMLTDVKLVGGKIESVIVATKSGLQCFTADTYADATGDGDLGAMAGVDFQLGREGDNLCQPVTMNLKIRNVDVEEIKTYIKENPEEFPNRDPELLSKAPRLSMSGFVRTLQAGKDSGEISFNREFILFFETNNPGEIIVNTTRIQRVNPTDAWELSQAEIEGRRQALELFQFLRKRVPGFGEAIIVQTGPNLGIRESRKIKGVYTLTTEDMFEDRDFTDEIARGGYPIDIHSPDGQGTNSKHLPWGASYGIPYRCLVNDHVDNLINVGRCISTTHEAMAAIRVSPIAMAIGHAGGLAAGLAAQNCGGSVVSMDVTQLRSKLRDQGAFIK